MVWTRGFDITLEMASVIDSYQELRHLMLNVFRDQVWLDLEQEFRVVCIVIFQTFNPQLNLP